MPLVSLLPREHGAYGQLTIPLATAFATAGVNAPAVLVAVAVVAAFLAHEPALVLLWRRGRRAVRQRSRFARVWLVTTAGIAVAAGGAAFALATSPVRVAMVLPLIPAALVVGAIATNREKSLAAEAAVALTFSTVAVPLCVAAGAPARIGLAIAVAFAAVFVTMTLSVRSIVRHAGDEGRQGEARSGRRGVLALATVFAMALLAAAERTYLPWTTLLAALPGLAAAAWLALFRPPPARLRRVGWMLMATSLTSAVILVMGLRGWR